MSTTARSLHQQQMPTRFVVVNKRRLFTAFEHSVLFVRMTCENALLACAPTISELLCPCIACVVRARVAVLGFGLFDDVFSLCFENHHEDIIRILLLVDEGADADDELGEVGDKALLGLARESEREVAVGEQVDEALVDLRRHT